MNTYPTSDESFNCLHRAGWSVGDVAVASGCGIQWVVSGTNGENAINARGASQAEAWYRAVQQVEAVGMARQQGHDFR